jgi:MFS family permease
MLVAIRSSWTLFIGIALIMLGNGLQGTLLGIRASLEGFSTTTTGMVMTAYFVGFLAGSHLVPKFVANVGHIRVFAALASLASISVLVHSVFIEPTLWTVMRFITGFSYAGLYVVAESWLNARATNETRGQLLSIYMIVTLLAMACGQLLLKLSEPTSFELFVLVSILVSLALVPISLTAINAPSFEAPERISLRTLYHASPLGVVGAAGVGCAHSVLFGMGAVYATQLGLSVDQVGTPRRIRQTRPVRRRHLAR